MTVKEYSFKSSSGLCDIKAWQWAPEGDVKAVIQMHHGMAEHSGRYKNFIKAFTDMGYAVFMHDMINHGKSNHDKSLLGYFGDKDGRKHLTADAKTLIDIAKSEYPDKKIIIAGHSMGSMIMRCFVADYGNDFDGAMFIGTTGPNPLAKAGGVVTKIIGAFKGNKYKSQAVYEIAFSAYDKPFEHRTRYDWGMRDQKSVDEYVADEYCGYLFTLAGYDDLMKLVVGCNSDAFYNTLAKDMPVLLTSGDMDPVGNYGKGIKFVYDKLVHTGHTNVTMQMYPDARHEILNEINKEEVYANINAWIENNIL